MSASPAVSLLVVGVGGQGAITAARVLGEAALIAGLPVRLGQLHGMSQRGGSVESTLVIGPGRTAFLPSRGADIVLGLEPLEVLRALPSLHPGSRVVVCRDPIVPTSMSVRGEEYPHVASIIAQLADASAELVAVAGGAVASSVDAPGALNAVLLGALLAQGWLPFGPEPVRAALDVHSAPARRDRNRRAFEAGWRAVAP